MTIKPWIACVPEYYSDEPWVVRNAMQAEIDELRAAVTNLQAYAKHERSLGAEPFAIENLSLRQDIDELRAALAEYKAKVTELEAQEAELCTLYALSQEECKKMQAKLDAQMSPVDYVKSLNERAKP